jgi:uncharacterized integral membrane protein
MIKFIRLLLAAVGLVLIVAFSVANRDIVEIGFWPFPQTIDLPVYGIVLVGVFVGAILGGLAVWLSTLRSRIDGGRAKRQVRSAEIQAARKAVEEERAAVDASRKRREALAIEAPKA